MAAGTQSMFCQRINIANHLLRGCLSYICFAWEETHQPGQQSDSSHIRQVWHIKDAQAEKGRKPHHGVHYEQLISSDASPDASFFRLMVWSLVNIKNWSLPKGLLQSKTKGQTSGQKRRVRGIAGIFQFSLSAGAGMLVVTHLIWI